MSEQQKDFKKLSFAVFSKKYTESQIKSLMGQYYKKHLAIYPVIKADSYTQTLDDAVKIFDGKVSLF